MDNTQKPESVEDNVVVSLDYTLKVDGEVVDSSKDTGPIEFIQGSGEVISGLEKGIQGMKVHQQKSITIQPDEGYGTVDPDALIEVPRSEFPEEIPLEPGIQVQVNDPEGHNMDATIVEVNDETVQLDFNHPLAGKQLDFDVTVRDLRTPTDEERAHGHVHSSDSHHGDES